MNTARHEYRNLNRAKVRAWNRKSWAKNREKHAARKKARRAVQTPLERRVEWIRHKYDVSEIEATRIASKTECDVCGNGPGVRSLHVDHDHTSGRIRGVLCHGCNVTLGLTGECVSTLRRHLSRPREFPCPWEWCDE